MIRSILRGAIAAFTLVGAAVFVSSIAYADPPIRGARLTRTSDRGGQVSPATAGALTLQSDTPGYTLYYSFSSDPEDNTYVASFTPDVPAIYSWANIVEEGGAERTEFAVETQFFAPDGTEVDSEWYQNDDGTVETYPEDAETFGAENVTRRFINIVGTPNATRVGQWTVNFSVDGDLVSTGNFNLEDAADIARGDAAETGRQALADAGYEVIEFTEAEGNTGNLFAYVIMLPISQDLYSSETSQQIVDGFAAVRQAFQDSTKLYVFLRADDRYEVSYFTDPEDVDAYLESNDFSAFSPTIGVDIYDNVEGEYLGTGTKDFIQKNFGTGTYQDPPNPPLAKTTSRVGSIRVTVSPSSLPADGASKAIVSIEVFDKRNTPIPDMEVTFEVGGSGEGIIRPRVTSTDENGQADAVFTAGRIDGSATITASAGGAIGTGVITIGQGGSDSPADNVVAFLSGQGYKGSQVGYVDAGNTAIGVLIDLGPNYDINDVVSPILYGMLALRLNYPEAATLVIYVPYNGNYLIFPATAAEFDSFTNTMDAAATDEERDDAIANFMNIVLPKSKYVDRTGKTLSTFKDFYNKEFSGS